MPQAWGQMRIHRAEGACTWKVTVHSGHSPWLQQSSWEWVMFAGGRFVQHTSLEADWDSALPTLDMLPGSPYHGRWPHGGTTPGETTGRYRTQKGGSQLVPLGLTL